MCTVTIIPIVEDAEIVGLRVANNRDELLARAGALPPTQRRYGERTARLPIDPDSGGTWIAANDAGLFLTLLNSHPEGHGGDEPDFLLSRGVIIPSLLHCVSVVEAIDTAGELDVTRYRPFRLVLLSHSELAELYSDGERLTLFPTRRLIAPRLFVSSGFGDEVVESRRRLFDEHFADDDDSTWVSRQEAFHRHSWPDRQHVSVCMRRDDAQTVSHTVIELTSKRSDLTYFSGVPDGRVAPVTASLDVSR